MTATLCGPGGVRAVIAEHLLLKQQLIVVRLRARPGSADSPTWGSRSPVTDDHTWGIDEVVADKGYHSNQVLTDLAALDRRSYIAKPDRGVAQPVDRTTNAACASPHLATLTTGSMWFTWDCRGKARSRRESMRSSWWRFTQPAKASTRKCSAWGMSRLAFETEYPVACPWPSRSVGPCRCRPALRRYTSAPVCGPAPRGAHGHDRSGGHCCAARLAYRPGRHRRAHRTGRCCMKPLAGEAVWPALLLTLVPARCKGTPESLGR